MGALYYYTARSTEGLQVRGSIEAPTQGAALANLRTRSLFVTAIEEAATVRGALAAALHVGPPSHKHLVACFRCFATLVRAGVPIRRSLDVTTEQCGNARLREALAAVSCDIESGLPLSAAMARHPNDFPRSFITMIRAGELGGILDEVLDRLAAMLERDRTLRKRVTSSLVYPAVVALAALALIVFLITTIVPGFRSMYDQMHVPLPWITHVLIAAGTALQRPALWIAGTVTVAVAVFYATRTRGRFDALCMGLPVIGAIARKAALARLARMLGTLLKSGVGLISAIEVTAETILSDPYRGSLAQLSQALGEGSSIAQPLSNSGVYEPMFVQMVRAGEETGALDQMLLRIADYYELDVETALTALGSILEPAMILVLGGAVGFIVAAIFIPLYTLIGSIK